jgi:hypothetical protein
MSATTDNAIPVPITDKQDYSAEARKLTRRHQVGRKFGKLCLPHPH